MQKKFVISYFIIFFLILLIMSFSTRSSEKMRGKTTAFFSPLWESLLSFRHAVFHPTTPSPFKKKSPQEEIEELALANQLLKTEIKFLRECVHMDNTLPFPSSFTPARIIFRSLDTWNHSFWVNVGSSSNKKNAPSVIGKHSPVLIGNHLIGLIDYLGEHQSRVRLIGNPSLILSVRVKRKKGEEILYLAKGELTGISGLARNHQHIRLKGEGFNYDFPDQKGEARDLITGKIHPASSEEEIPIIQKGDLLVTTGLDGIFPEDLEVAQVSHVLPLREGDYCYTIEALPLSSSLNEMTLLFILPPYLQEESSPLFLNCIK